MLYVDHIEARGRAFCAFTCKTALSGSVKWQPYLKGRYQAAQYTQAGVNKGIDSFRQAIKPDPLFSVRLSQALLAPRGTISRFPSFAACIYGW